jgi:NADH:ubiquinone oxidoreductase subunit C
MNDRSLRMRIKYNMINILINLFLNDIKMIKISKNNLILFINSDLILKLSLFLKLNTLMLFKQLMDITAVDYIYKTSRFELNYNLLSVNYNLRFLLKLSTESFVMSLKSIFSSSN